MNKEWEEKYYKAYEKILPRDVILGSIAWVRENILEPHFIPKSQLLEMIDSHIEAGHQSRYIEYAQGYLAALEEIKEKIIYVYQTN